MNNIKITREQKNIKQIELADFLNVSQGTLSNWERGKHDPDSESLIKMADYFNVTVDYLLGKKETDRDKKINTILNKIPLPLYMLPVSAGTGQWVEEGYEYELTQFEDVPKGTDFVLRVRGDSMEPVYNDNDLVFIKQNSLVEPGQVGVFFLNGEGYLKMLQGNKLVSFNSKYKPITIGEDDSFLTLGKVIGKNTVKK